MEFLLNKSYMQIIPNLVGVGYLFGFQIWLWKELGTFSLWSTRFQGEFVRQTLQCIFIIVTRSSWMTHYPTLRVPGEQSTLNIVLMGHILDSRFIPPNRRYTECMNTGIGHRPGKARMATEVFCYLNIFWLSDSTQDLKSISMLFKTSFVSSRAMPGNPGLSIT